MSTAENTPTAVRSRFDPGCPFTRATGRWLREAAAADDPRFDEAVRAGHARGQERVGQL